MGESHMVSPLDVSFYLLILHLAHLLPAHFAAKKNPASVYFNAQGSRVLWIRVSRFGFPGMRRFSAAVVYVCFVHVKNIPMPPPLLLRSRR